MSRMFLLNLFLALTYILLTGQTGAFNFGIGFAIGAFVLWLYDLSTGSPTYIRRLWHLVRFGLWFLYILTKANLQIAWEIITPGMSQTPRILRYDVEGMSDIEITTLANCITLTPGTLVVDVSDDKRWMYVHCMYAENREQAIAELDELADRLKQEVFPG